jgi:Family of unknown function (DUF6348)
VLEIDLNPQFADLLKNHGIAVDVNDGFITTDLPDSVKFRARIVYQEVNENISSRLDVMAMTDKGEQIFESCGDYGATIEEVVINNFQNFSASTLHPLLAALGCIDPETYKQITIEEWEINEKLWTVYIGNLVPKILTNSQNTIEPPSEFFDRYIRLGRKFS